MRRGENRRSAAFQAAEAGIDDYIAKLTEDHSYYLHYVHPAESARRNSAGTVVQPNAIWDGSVAWTYPTPWSAWRTLANGYQYSLSVVPPTVGSPNITLTATGRAPGTGERRRLEVVVRTGSIADFQMIANADISYGSTATTTGKIYAGIDSSNVRHSVAHSGNIYANVMAENQVTGVSSSRLFNGAKAYDRDSSPTVRAVVQSPINFNQFTETLLDVRAAAQASGVLLENSAVHAWRITFLATGQMTIDTCLRSGSYHVAESTPVCTFNRTVNVPLNGAIYAAQSVVVRGVVDGQATIVSNGDIIIGENVTYEVGGNDVLGLIARNNILMAQWSPSSLTLNAAVIAQTGQYRSYTSSALKSGTFTHRGAVATNLGGYMSMFTTRVYQYDANLLFLQPPFFPTLEESYSVLGFRELEP